MKTVPSTNQATWDALCSNLANSATEWYISMTQGFTVAGGFGGVGVEYLRGTVVIKSDMNPNLEYRLHYSAKGGGLMTPGAGASGSTFKFPNKGSYLVRGVSAPAGRLRLDHLTGPCLIIDGSGSVAGRIPLPKGYQVRIATGGGGSVSIFFFGVSNYNGNSLLIKYKAAALVVGLAGTVSATTGGSLGLTVSYGDFTL